MDIEMLNLNQPLTNTRPCVLALGFFDGVHRGHQHVILQAKKQAQKLHLPLAVMTFDVHAGTVFGHPCFYLTSLQQKAALMAKLGVDKLYVVHFTKAFANLSPQAFVEQYLVGLQAKVVVAGFDYTFGAGGSNTIDDLPALAQGRFATMKVAAKLFGGQKISSTRIRQLVQAGRIQDAEILLGHAYQPQTPANLMAAI